MHELSIASGILDIVRQYVPGRDAARVRAVRVRVGDLAGVVPGSLEFCFEAIVAGSAYADAFLEIDEVPALATCGDCGCLTRLRRPPFDCPACGSLGMAFQSGDELQVVDVDLDDAVEMAS